MTAVHGVSLRQQRLHHFAKHIREPEIAALGSEGELLMVHAEEVQRGGLEIMDVNGVTHHADAEFIVVYLGSSDVAHPQAALQS